MNTILMAFSFLLEDGPRETESKDTGDTHKSFRENFIKKIIKNYYTLKVLLLHLSVFNLMKYYIYECFM